VKQSNSIIAQQCFHAVWAAAACIALVFVAGCDGVPRSSNEIGSVEHVEAGDPSRAGAWLYWPSSIRVHPLTRIDRASPTPSIDVRVEFRDETGDATKAVGTLIVAVECADAEPRAERWKIVLDSIEAHRKYFDAVTATYRIPVAPMWTQPPATGSIVTVRAYLFGADGAMPTASERLTW